MANGDGDWEHRLTRLETMFKDKWEAHDKRSEEIWAEVKDDMRGVKTNLNTFLLNIPCKTHIEKFKGYDTSIKWLTTLMMLMVGGCVGGFWWLLRS